MKKSSLVVSAVLLVVAAALFVSPHLSLRVIGKAEAATGDEASKLMVLWTSADREVALKMVYMYTYNAKKQGWFDDVTFIVWGPSARLLSVDTELQDYVKKMIDEDVTVLACKACADMYGVSDKLAAMGIDVHYVGKDVSDMLKSGWVTMTF